MKTSLSLLPRHRSILSGLRDGAFAALAILFLQGAPAQASLIVASFEDALTEITEQKTIPAGWSFYWNRTAAVGQSASYEPLILATASDGFGVIRTPDAYFGKTPSGYLRLGKINGELGGVPGYGSTTASGSGYATAVIIAYTFAEAGEYSIENGLLTATGPWQIGGGGLNLSVWIDDSTTPHYSTSIAGFTPVGTSESFSTSLGYLEAGSRVYLSIDPGVTATNKNFSLDYQIVSIPEPATMSLVAVAGVWLIARRRKTATTPASRG